MKRIGIISLLLLGVAVLHAGDIASFANLGFSDDSRYCMFGFYGIDEENLNQYAELYVVDVQRNQFAPGGAKQSTYTVPPEPGQNGFGGLMTLYRDSIPAFASYKVNHLKSGRLLYLLVNGASPKSAISFRDFQAGRGYEIELIQAKQASGETVSASFHINLTVTDSKNGRRSYVVGIPGFHRTGVSSYRIWQILSAPNDSALVFVIEKEERGKSGLNIRYMVETVSLR